VIAFEYLIFTLLFLIPQTWVWNWGELPNS